MSWALSQCPCVAHHIFVAEFYLGSFFMIAHARVCYRRQEFVFAVSVCEACACFCLRVRQCMCSRSKPSSDVTTPVTATIYKESVVMGSFAVSVCCTPHFFAEFFIWGHSIRLRTHMCVTEGRSSCSQFPFGRLAHVSVFECANACAAEASHRPLSRLL